MSPVRTIGKLEALLARVRARAAAPREHPAEVAKPALPAAGEVLADAAAPSPAQTDVDLVVEVDGNEPHGIVQAEMTAIDEPSPVEIEKVFESRERLVAAESLAPEAPADLPEAAIASARPAAFERESSSGPDMEVVVEESTVDESADSPPASSRRTVAPEPEERIAQIAFGAEEPQAPLHTPPPESGQLPTTTAVVEFDGDVTGVREAPLVVPIRQSDASALGAIPAAAVPILQPEAARARVASSDAVVELIGEAQRFAPSRFVALLDASLAL